MGVIGDVVARVHQPEYTGDNRCGPCTVLNVLIAIVIAGLLVGVGRLWIGVTVFIVFTGIIYLRGYLVPGTPAITERYFPGRVLQLFGKDPPDYSADLREMIDDEPEERELVEVLTVAGVLMQDEANEINLTPDFRDVWRERIYAIRERELGAADVRAMYNADTITTHGPTSFVVDKNKSVRWEAKAALSADVAAATELGEWFDEWDAFTKSERDRVFTGLRLFLRRCPACDESLSVVEKRVDPCCQKAHIVVQSVCPACDETLVDAAVVDSEEGVSTQLRVLQP